MSLLLKPKWVAAAVPVIGLAAYAKMVLGKEPATGEVLRSDFEAHPTLAPLKLASGPPGSYVLPVTKEGLTPNPDSASQEIQNSLYVIDKTADIH